MTGQSMIELTTRRQVEEELKEFDHSDQTILMKLVEVYWKRKDKDDIIAAKIA